MIRRFLVAAFLLGGPAAADPQFWRHEWPDTDFGTSSVSFAEILSGGPPKDGIPALDDPAMIPVARATDIPGREPVIALEVEDETPRAYPVRYLIWHEIANDAVGGVPVAVTFCPLCNSGIVFDRRVDGRTLSFGVSGKLRHSDMVMYDRETESWWQQAIGEGIVGEMTGRRLRPLPSWMESWDEFRVRNPEGLVMARPAFPRDYGRNPYAGYDGLQRPFLYSGELPPNGVPALERVVRVGDRAWPMTRLADEERIEEAGISLDWTAGQASALDAGRISEGRDVGTVRVRDAATGGDLPHDVMFAFAFHAFWPQGTWMMGE